MNPVEAERARCAKVALDCAEGAEAFIREKCGGTHNDIQRWAEACRHVAGLIIHGDNWHRMQMLDAEDEKPLSMRNWQ